MGKIKILLLATLVGFSIKHFVLADNSATAEIKITGKVVANAELVVKIDGVESKKITLENYIKGGGIKDAKLISFELKDEYSKENIVLKDIEYSGNTKEYYKIEKVTGGNGEKNFKISYNTKTLDSMAHGSILEDTIVFTATYE